MKARHYLKGGIKMVIDCDLNMITLVVRSSKKGIFQILDALIPDEVI